MSILHNKRLGLGVTFSCSVATARKKGGQGFLQCRYCIKEISGHDSLDFTRHGSSIHGEAAAHDVQSTLRQARQELPAVRDRLRDDTSCFLLFFDGSLLNKMRPSGKEEDLLNSKHVFVPRLLAVRVHFRLAMPIPGKLEKLSWSSYDVFSKTPPTR